MAKQLTHDQIVGYLIDARQSIHDESVRYSDWDQCVCGLTHLAVTGRRARIHVHITTPGAGTKYAQVLNAMANTEFVNRASAPTATSSRGTRSCGTQSAFKVSEAYAQYCKRGGNPGRDVPPPDQDVEEDRPGVHGPHHRGGQGHEHRQGDAREDDHPDRGACPGLGPRTRDDPVPRAGVQPGA